MAQLIKLNDYISRYEWNAYRYPSQYIRLKQDNWKKLHRSWINKEVLTEKVVTVDTTQPSAFSRLKAFMSNNAPEEEIETVKEKKLPETEAGLKQYFLNELYPLQLKWATSTMRDVSFIDKSYYNDPILKYFLQRFPDIYLIMYYPIFNIRNASIDGQIILISPIEIEIIYLMEEDEETTIMAGDDRTWTTERRNVQTNSVSPLITLKRTEQIIKSILSTKQIDLPVTKTILSRTNNIVFSSEPYNTNIIGKFQYEDWFQEKRKLSSPLKSKQLKAAEVLLSHCITNSIRRPEWEVDPDPDPFTAHSPE